MNPVITTQSLIFFICMMRMITPLPSPRKWKIGEKNLATQQSLLLHDPNHVSSPGRWH